MAETGGAHVDAYVSDMSRSRQKKPNRMMRCGNPKCPDKGLWVADGHLTPNAGDDPSKVHDVWSAKEPVGHFICPRCGHYTIRHAGPRRALREETR